MKSCIIFACTIIDIKRLNVLTEFLDSFQQNFSDVDIYVGINNVSITEVESVIKSYKLNIVSMSRCSAELYTESDASAYQEALKNLIISKNRYENYWFVHTKSGVNDHSNYLRKWYIDNFLKSRNSIEMFIDSMPGIGSYGMLGLEFDEMRNYNETDCDISLFKNELTKELPCTHANFFYIHTLYVINKNSMEVFLKLISDTWVKTKLDRYYFEGVFPFIVSRSGYFPYLENQFSCSRTDLSPYIKKWVMENNLNSYIDYINMFKTNFIFDQLYPPYVNSNS
jgi:hypothetical protein